MDYKGIEKTMSEIVLMNGGDDFAYSVELAMHHGNALWAWVGCSVTDIHTGITENVHMILYEGDKDLPLIGEVHKLVERMTTNRTTLLNKRKAELESELEKLVEASR